MTNLGKRNVKVVTPEAANPAQAARVIAGRYRLAQQLGKGGNARVYFATDTRNGKPVALKLFFRELERDPQFVARFRKEVKIASSLNHPNIVRTLDYGYDDERYYLVMEYVDGGNLQNLIHRRGRLSLPEVVNFVGQLCDALEYAHSQGIIHRDIKPQNVLIDSQEHIKLSDFGLARAIANTGLTVTGPTIGTIGYLAPEQIQNAKLTVRTDIYALGVMMFEMVTGRLPFENDSALAVALAHVRERAPRPRKYNPEVSPRLELIIEKCMEKDPANRYASVQELKHDLIGCFSKETNQSLPVPVLEQQLPVHTRDTHKLTEKDAAPHLSQVISLPTAIMQSIVTEEKTQEMPIVGKRPGLHERETNPIIGEVTSDDRLPDSVTPRYRETTQWTGALFSKRNKKARVALGFGVMVLLVALGLLALLGFNLVNQARVEAQDDPTGTAIAAAATATASATNPVTVKPFIVTPPAGTSQEVRVGGNLTGVNVWRPQDGPVLVTQELVIGSGASLTIEPGVIVKMAANIHFRVEGGKLVANGTAEQPIIFTSAQEQPKAGDWGGLIIQKGASAQLSQIEIRYGGSDKATILDPKHPALLVTDSKIELSASKITQSAGAGLIILGKSSGSVTGNSFSNNTDFHVYIDVLNKAVFYNNNRVDVSAKVRL
jgi:serine/threonine protein kinase